MIDLSTLHFRGKPLGTNPGGIFENSSGDRYHAKIYARGDQARAEVLAARLYEQAGLWTVRPELALDAGRICVMSPWFPGLEEPDWRARLENEAHREEMATVYAVSMLVRNRDTLGYNVQAVGRDGRLVVVDTGATFGWRGNGVFDYYLPTLGEGGHIFFDLAPAREGAIFGDLFRRSPNLMATCLADLDTLDLERALGGLGYSHAQESDLREIFESRRQLLVGLAQDYGVEVN